MKTEDRETSSAAFAVNERGLEARLPETSTNRILGFFGKTSGRARITEAMSNRIAQKMEAGDFNFSEQEKFFLYTLFNKEFKKITNQLEVYQKASAILDGKMARPDLPSITGPAPYPSLPPSASIDHDENGNEGGRETSEDWIMRFWAYVESVSDEYMQQVYARIAANESRTPGAFSLHTLVVMQGLDRNILEKFEKVCSLLVNDWMLLSSDETMDYLQGKSIGWLDLLELEAVGLIALKITDATARSNSGDSVDVEMNYFDRSVRIQGRAHSWSGNQPVHRFSGYTLTVAGWEISRIPVTQPDEEYFRILLETLAEKWKVTWTVDGETFYDVSRLAADSE